MDSFLNYPVLGIHVNWYQPVRTPWVDQWFGKYHHQDKNWETRAEGWESQRNYTVLRQRRTYFWVAYVIRDKSVPLAPTTCVTNRSRNDFIITNSTSHHLFSSPNDFHFTDGSYKATPSQWQHYFLMFTALKLGLQCTQFPQYYNGN